MSERAGEKTEQATPKRLEEALKKGQFARSPEIQTVFVLCAGMLAIRLAGPDAWERMLVAFAGIFQNLHKISLGEQNLQRYAIQSALMFSIIAGPFVVCTVCSSLLAGGIQSQFRTASDALEPDWERVNPMAGFKRIFSPRSLVPTSLSFLKLLIIGTVCWIGLKSILEDPIFFTAI